MARYKAVILAYLPNKKILFLVVFILLIFAGGFYFSDYKNRQIQYIADKEKSPLAVALDTTSQLDADTDGDGLKDWEELLWKTDAGKADTDGDGTNDNEEITLNRNPLKVGPDDKISEKEDLVAQEKAVSESKQNTLTAAYAKQFLTDYLLLKQQKGELSEEDKTNLVEKFMGNMEPLVVADKYKLSDLKISDDNSKGAIEKYAREMKKIMIEKKYIFLDDEAVFEALLKKLKNKTDDYSEEVWGLNYSAALYDVLTQQLISLIVPAVLSKEHLEAVNGFRNVSIALKKMLEAPSDLINAMMGLKLQEEQIKNSEIAIKKIQVFFDDYRIYIF